RAATSTSAGAAPRGNAVQPRACSSTPPGTSAPNTVAATSRLPPGRDTASPHGRRRVAPGSTGARAASRATTRRRCASGPARRPRRGARPRRRRRAGRRARPAAPAPAAAPLEVVVDERVPPFRDPRPWFHLHHPRDLRLAAGLRAQLAQRRHELRPPARLLGEEQAALLPRLLGQPQERQRDLLDWPRELQRFDELLQHEDQRVLIARGLAQGERALPAPAAEQGEPQP